jgi:hypothetical protein
MVRWEGDASLALTTAGTPGNVQLSPGVRAAAPTERLDLQGAASFPKLTLEVKLASEGALDSHLGAAWTDARCRRPFL